jgi:hypothetical protein
MDLDGNSPEHCINTEEVPREPDVNHEDMGNKARDRRGSNDCGLHETSDNGRQNQSRIMRGQEAPGAPSGESRPVHFMTTVEQKSPGLGQVDTKSAEQKEQGNAPIAQPRESRR